MFFVCMLVCVCHRMHPTSMHVQLQQAQTFIESIDRLSAHTLQFNATSTTLCRQAKKLAA